LVCSGWRTRRTGLIPGCCRAWLSERLLRSIAWLRLENMRGRNVYIRPQGEHHLSLVDDLSKSAIERMKAEGFVRYAYSSYVRVIGPLSNSNPENLRGPKQDRTAVTATSLTPRFPGFRQLSGFVEVLGTRPIVPGMPVAQALSPSGLSGGLSL
jgi:hypothetical protein